jgi:hypothetical protein
VLTVSNIFDESSLVGGCYIVYTITLTSAASSSTTATHFVQHVRVAATLDVPMVSTFFSPEEWFRDPTAYTPFEMAQGHVPMKFNQD